MLDPYQVSLMPNIHLLGQLRESLHSLDNQSEKYIAEKIKVHPFFVSVYIRACTNYSFEDCRKIISYIKKWITIYRFMSIKKNQKFVVFYSENKNYWIDLKGIIEEIFKILYGSKHVCSVIKIKLIFKFL